MKLKGQMVKHLDQLVFDNMVSVRTRGVIKYARKLFKDKPMVGVEIGLNTGLNAENILSTCNIKKLYCVDIVKMDAEKRLKRFKNKYEIIYGDSCSKMVLDLIPEGLDFVYVDGDHSYNGVKNDIKNYYPKTRVGGVFGGHDFSVHQWPVAKAVIEFIEKEGLKLRFSPSRESDWWIVK